MDFSEATRIVYNKIQKLESEHASKIIGFLLLQDHGEDEVIRLANEPESSIISLVSKAKSELGLSLRPATIVPMSVSSVPISDQPLQYTAFTPAPSRTFSLQSTIRVPSPFWESQVGGDQPNAQNSDFLPSYFVGEGLHVQDSVEDQLDNTLGPEFSNNYYFPEQAMVGNLNIRTSRQTSTAPEYAVKACHYFNKGNCRHGMNCRFFHGQAMQDGYSQLINSSHSEIGPDDHLFLPGSLEKLEIELTELLMSRRGMPVSIASLPMLYFEKFGRNLQAEGYLTESQRHGKAGFSLTKLLARLSNNIRVIDR